MPAASLSLSEARRIALAAQGFGRRRPAGAVSLRHIRAVVHRLGLIQIDFVNVLVPAHYLVLFSRLGPFDRQKLDHLTFQRHEFTEHWAHEASILPVQTWPLLKHRMEDKQRVAYGAAEKLGRAHRGHIEAVLEHVRQHGAVAAADLPEPPVATRRVPGQWHRSMNRMILEGHFSRGLLAVRARLPNLARVYDLPERVIDHAHLQNNLSREDAMRQLLLLSAAAHGVGTAGDLADYYRLPIVEARARIAELAEAGELQPVRVDGWREPAYLQPGARLPKRLEACALLSPFDPVVWHRPRGSRLFDFDYRIEIYVPEAKRKWGYYVLPFLMGERLVARVDLKADRALRQLVVRAAYLEPGIDAKIVADGLAGELELLAAWLALESVKVERRGDLARQLGQAVAGRR